MSAQPRAKIVRLSELKPGERGTFFALLADRSRSSTSKGNPFFTCRFRDARRIASFMVWGAGPHFEDCDKNWKPGQFFKIDGIFSEHERYGPQFEVKQIRLVVPRDEADGFFESDFIEGVRFKPEVLLTELREMIERNIGDEPLRRLTLGLIDKHAETLKNLPATDRKFYPYRGGWLEHT